MYNITITEEIVGIYQRNRQILYELNVQKKHRKVGVHQMKLRIIYTGNIFYFIQFI